MGRPYKSKEGPVVKCSITLSRLAHQKVVVRMKELGLNRSAYVERAVVLEGVKPANG